MARDDADSWSYALDCATTSVKSFTACLQAIKLSKRCRARVRADARGVTFATMDESKSCGASVNFRAETFARYACDETCAALVGGRAQRGGARAVAFDVNLGALIDALGAFGRGDGELVARWPNREGMLTLELESAKGQGGERELRQCVYAEIAPEMVPEDEERGEEVSFRDEANAFMLPTATLKEIVDDLEWPNGDVLLECDVDMLKFSAHGAEIGDLAVDVDVGATGRLTEFSCAQPSASRYKYRFLKSAMAVGGSFLGGGGAGAGGGGGDDTVTMTRVSISNVGFLKIVHLLHLSRGQVSFGAEGGLNAFMVPVTYILHPIEADADEYADEE